MTAPDVDVRERLLGSAYACVARFGLTKTTVDDVAKESGLSRATVYRYFPGGKDQLLREAVAWEMGNFFNRLAETVAHAPDFASLVEESLMFASRSVAEHSVLQKVLITEPERLLPLITIESERTREFIAGYLLPYLEREEREGRLRPGVDRERAVDYVARMLLSLIASPGRWDLDDREQVRTLVREELLGGVLKPEFLP